MFLPGSMWVTFANTPLAKETHMAKLRIRGKEIDPTCLVRETIKSHGKEPWRQGETGAIYAINLLRHGKKLTDMYNGPE